MFMILSGVFPFISLNSFGNKSQNTINVFISYSTKDATLAGKIKSCFEKCVGFDVFLAHDDLTVSSNWPKEILNHLTKSDFIIPLLSKRFMRSYFANQEIGIAYCKEKKIIPFSLDGVNSDGFIRDIQAHKSHSASAWNEGEIIRAVVTVFLLSIKDPEYKEYSTLSVSCLLRALEKSDLKKTTDTIVNILLLLRPLITFNNNQIKLIRNACINNPNIYNAKLSFPKLKKFLHDLYKIEIDR